MLNIKTNGKKRVLVSVEERGAENITFRVTASQRKQIEEMAAKYTRGNKSAWLSYAALNFKPGKKDLVSS